MGDRVPDFCLGNPAYRMMTVIHFTGKHLAIGRRMATTFSSGTACVKRQNGFRRGMTPRRSRAMPRVTYSLQPILTEQSLRNWVSRREQQIFACSYSGEPESC